MGMYDSLRDIVKVLRFDEILLRLLYYPPENLANNTPDPLSDTLQNILTLDVDWKIRDKRIMLIPKSDDLVTTPLCRIYVYAGRRIPTTSNYITANQQVIIDVLCHNDFEKDLRSMRIGDRLNELLVMERITGIGKTDYVGGGQINSAPSGYIGYTHAFEFASFKK